MILRQLLESALQRMPFYAVARGRQVGIFNTWPECQKQVNGFNGARFKKFSTESEARQFIEQHSASEIGVSRTNAPVTGKRSFSTTTETAQPAKKQPRKTIQNVCNMVAYGQYSFLQDEDDFVHVYTDGSCEGNGQAHAAAGLGVYFAEDHALNTSMPVSGRATNNCGEIQAASMAIRLARAHGVRRLVVNTDSQFLINSITKWLPGWKKRNWTLASGGPVKNKTDFEELERELSSGDITIKWNHVDAHCGILGNERADELARKGTEMHRAQRRTR